MAEDQQNETDFTSLILKLPLFSQIVREHLWLEKFTVSKEYLKRAVEDPKIFKDFSVLKSIFHDNPVDGDKQQQESDQSNKSQPNSNYHLKLYKDLGWHKVPKYYWPIESGDYSPLSPDGEFLDRQGKIGLDFWNWNRESSPLGYVPPLCTCKMTIESVNHLRRWARNMTLDFDNKVCENDVCRGLLYIPYSLLEIPLNRIISNCSEFALKVRVPNSTDLYCGNMKHTIVLCTSSRKHEEECLRAIEKSEISSPLVYDVSSDDFIPYFKRYNEEYRESPLMSVEPIDSDVSDSEENYGLGQLFAIRRLKDHLLIEKYDQNTRTTAPLDEQLLNTWDKMCKGLEDKRVKRDSEQRVEEDKGKEGVKYNSARENKKSGKRKLGEKETKATNNMDLGKLKKELSNEDYKLYQMIESFSSNRRPLNFSLRDQSSQNSNSLDVNKDYDIDKEPSKKAKTTKVDQNKLKSVHLLNTLSKI